MATSPAGYSGTPLPKKLGIKEGHRLLLLDAPDDFVTSTLGPLPDGVEIATTRRGTRPFDVLVAFVRRQTDLRRRIAELRPRMTPAAGLWIAWPKRASGVATDVTEDVVRAEALSARLVDNKVCAVDATWSGLRLVIRLRDRSS